MDSNSTIGVCGPLRVQIVSQVFTAPGPYLVDNKYFTARVTVAEVSEPSDPPFPVIIVCGGDPSTFLPLLSGAEIKLVVKRGHDADTFAWCLENGAEYVDLDSSASPEDHEPSGVDRIKEAVSTHMWPNLVRKGDDSSAAASELDTERQLEGFERALASLMDAKQRGAGLSDSERRELAMETMLKVVEDLGLEDE